MGTPVEPFCQRDESFYSTAVSGQYGILDYLQLVVWYVIVGYFRCRIHYAEIHSVLNCVIEEYGMYCLTDVIVPPEGKGEIAHPAAYVCERKVVPNPCSRLYEVGCISVVLLYAGRYCQNVRVKDDVGRIHADNTCQQVI